MSSSVFFLLAAAFFCFLQAEPASLQLSPSCPNLLLLQCLAESAALQPKQRCMMSRSTLQMFFGSFYVLFSEAAED